ncbi:MAG: hypothetical protein AAGJ35_13595, partial [Myxococcota bacterium]
ADFASQCKAQGTTLVEALEKLYCTYGYFANTQVAMIMEGAIGLARIRDLIANLRKQPPSTIAGRKVEAFFDHWDETGIFGPIRSETDRSARNVLVFHLEDDVRIIMRPSGTEPKAKIYVEIPTSAGLSEQELHNVIAQTNQQARTLGSAFAQQALAQIDIELPTYAFFVSDLVSIDNKVRFVQEVLPQWVEHTQKIHNTDDAVEQSATFLTQALAPIHKSPRVLFLSAIEVFLETQINLEALQTLRQAAQQLP